MSKEMQYKCDVTGDVIDEDDAVPVAVKEIRANSDYRSQSRETRVETSNGLRNVEHISQEVLDEHDFQTEDFNKLEVLILEQEIVGWRDFNPHVTTEPHVATDEQATFLESLTHL